MWGQPKSETVKIARNASYSTYIKDILLLPNLVKLKLCFAAVSQEEKRTLVRRAIELNMQYLSIVNYSGNGEWVAQKETERLSEGIRQCNLQRHRRLLQTMLLLRNKHLRKMSTIFVDELFEQLD